MNPTSVSHLALWSRAPMFRYATFALATTSVVIALLTSPLECGTWTKAAVASAIVGMMIFVASCAVDIFKERDPPET